MKMDQIHGKPQENIVEEKDGIEAPRVALEGAQGSQSAGSIWCHYPYLQVKHVHYSMKRQRVIIPIFTLMIDYIHP